MKTILIQGINSFSGSTLAKSLEKTNHKVFGTFHSKKNDKYLLYNKKKIKTFKVDNLNISKLKRIFKEIKPDIVFDFASICMVNESWKNKKYYRDVNVLSKKKLINFLIGQKYIKKYIYISTPEIFGSRKNIDEYSSKYKPSTPYAKSKLDAEKLFRHFYKKFNFPIIITRFSNFYGPGQPIYRLIPKIFIQIKKNKKFNLHGGGTSKRNFLYSSDFCNGLKKVMSFGKVGDIYHFSGKQLVSILSIVNAVCRVLNKKKSDHIVCSDDRRSKDQFYFLNCKKTIKSLKWRPKVKLNQGLKKTIRFYKNNYKYLKNEKSEYIFTK